VRSAFVRRCPYVEGVIAEWARPSRSARVARVRRAAARFLRGGVAREADRHVVHRGSEAGVPDRDRPALNEQPLARGPLELPIESLSPGRICRCRLGRPSASFVFRARYRSRRRRHEDGRARHGASGGLPWPALQRPFYPAAMFSAVSCWPFPVLRVQLQYEESGRDPATPTWIPGQWGWGYPPGACRGQCEYQCMAGAQICPVDATSRGLRSRPGSPTRAKRRAAWGRARHARAGSSDPVHAGACDARCSRVFGCSTTSARGRLRQPADGAHLRVSRRAVVTPNTMYPAAAPARVARS